MNLGGSYGNFESLIVAELPKILLIHLKLEGELIVVTMLHNFLYGKCVLISSRNHILVEN